MSKIPFFAHWYKKKVRNLLSHAKLVHTVRGEILQTQDKATEFVYLVTQGEFRAIKREKTDIPSLAEDARVRQFLQGTSSKRSMRGIIN